MTKKQKIQEEVDKLPPGRESPAGVHFSGLYLDCPRKFAYKYLMGLQPTQVGRALNFGIVMHEATYRAYLHRDPEWGLEWGELHLNKLSPKYYNIDHWEQDINRFRPMFQRWLDEWWEHDISTYNFICLEEQLSPVLANGVPITIRPDRVFQHKSNGVIIIPDTKTSTYSANSALDTMKAGEQATSYIWGWKHFYPNHYIDGVMVDTIFTRIKRDGTVDYNKIQVQRPMVRRNPYRLMSFELGMIGIMAEIAQKVQAYYAGMYPMELLFPRPPLSPPCSKFPCEYSSICEKPCRADYIPPGFQRDPWVEEGLIRDMLIDRESIYQYMKITSDKYKE